MIQFPKRCYYSSMPFICKTKFTADWSLWAHHHKITTPRNLIDCIILESTHFIQAIGSSSFECMMGCPKIISHMARFFTYSYILEYISTIATWHLFVMILLYPRPTKLEGGYTGFTLSVRLSVCPSVRPSVCRRHGFRSISQVCFGISISNFICMLMVAIGRSLLIFSDVTFKMAAWRPYWIIWFPDSNFTLALNINFKLQRHNTYVYG